MLYPDRIEYLAKRGIRYVEVMDRFGGNEGLYRRLATRFLDDPHMGLLEEALDAGDAEAAYNEAHSLKGVAGNLSFAALYLAVSEVSGALREGRLEDARALMPAARRAYEDVCDGMRTMKYCWDDPE